MTRLIINKLSIIDYEHKKANSFSFSQKSNLVISCKNGQGKSSVVKSLYYALGANIKSFPNGWKPENYIFQLEVSINNKICTIKRHNKVISVKTEDDSRIFKDLLDYAIWLQEQMGMKLDLVTKNSVTRKPAYVEALMIPFYIDQDRGWSGSVYKDSFEGIGLYESKYLIKDIMAYYLEISDTEIQNKDSQLNALKNESKFLDGKIEQLQSVYKTYQEQKSVSESPVKNIKDLTVELEQYIGLTDKLSKDIQKVTKNFETKKRELDIYQQDKVELELLLKAIDKRFKDIKYECSYCHSKLTREQSLTRLELDDNRLAIISKKEELIQKIAKLKEKIKNDRDSILLLEEKFSWYHKRLNELKSITDIESYISQNVLNELRGLEREEIQKKTVLEIQIKELGDVIRRSKTELKKKQDLLKGDFENYKNMLSRLINSNGLVKRHFNDFKKLTGSGTNFNRDLLVFYLVYMNLIIDRTKFKLPNAIDSFLKNETDRDSLERMFNAVNSYFLTLDTQTFFSIIEDNLKYIDKGCKQIWIESPILREDLYNEISSTLIEVDEQS